MQYIRDIPWIKQYPLFQKYIDKLSTRGVYTTVDLLTETKVYDLALSNQIPYDFLDNIKKRCLADIGSIEVTSALDVYKRKLNYQKIIKTGSSSYDEMLGGGFRQGYIYEIIGDEATGKTHLCHHLCIEVAKSGQKCLYIDTKACFSSEKLIMEISELNGDQNKINFESTLNNIFVQRPTDVYQICDILQFIMEDEDGYKNIELLVIDALDALVEPHFTRLQSEDWVGDQVHVDPDFQANSVKERQFQFSLDLTTILKQLLLLNEKLCIVIVNSSGRWLGPSWKHTAQVILTNTKLENGKVLQVQLTKSLNQSKMNKCNVEVCVLGFKDHHYTEL